MIVGCLVSVFAMMLLGWAREISAFFGGVRPSSFSNTHDNVSV